MELKVLHATCSETLNDCTVALNKGVVLLHARDYHGKILRFRQ